ncbi:MULTISPECIES: extracellular solute-binding protein [Rhodobacterales]|jgi:spermidine/putrescine transport system substrate-binding protein|uniref:extracellular solute-binding protein n=1 Tax=Rhodobacterales TaxID=204455 RepID=UPI00237F72C2|nr:extracellular solute-binding protein [Phaeobacter gallaeciensis]MDE4139910.1 extracellular solute-binding protein [Phaeobacter gallaeciensis]MDE4148480.1 extracellular solute-binding protein [Phaeobacter gallaeciensis]MDE4152575.1 extracellular solute-binding protein [Phaeobacter gallaeciensis]MDE4228091.1 extracellular solute-binding protein [Phaeobacter gallaeciensis]MDE4257039.1 extracellular solute-binding protein [Phaeobacter gallaeciensis]
MKLTILKAGLTSVIALSAAAANAEGTLNIYNWGNYTNPEMIEKFEKQYDIEVTLDGYDSNETMLAKVKEGGSGYDIVVPGDYMVAIMVGEGLLAEINASEMENFKNLDPNWVDVYWDPGRKYSVPYQWGTTSFTVDSAVYGGDIDTLEVVFNPPEELKGRINMLNDMNDVINAGLRYLDYPRCNSDPAQMKELLALLLKAKEDWRTMDYAVIEKLTSKDVDLSQSWNGAAMRARADRPTLKYAYPKEGFTGWMDNVAVLADAPNMENAKLFVNFMMEPENAAMTSNFARYANGVIGSEEFMDAEMLEAPEIVMPEGAPVPDFVKPCDQDVVAMYNKVWTRLKQ